MEEQGKIMNNSLEDRHYGHCYEDASQQSRDAVQQIIRTATIALSFLMTSCYIDFLNLFVA